MTHFSFTLMDTCEISEDTRLLLKKLIATTCIGICALQTLIPALASDELMTHEITQDFHLIANFNADGNVDLRWDKVFPDGFEYYQIVRSTKNAEPMYPDDDYIYFTTNKNDLIYEDDDIPEEGTLHYRICAYAGAHSYCSPSTKVTDVLSVVTPSVTTTEFVFKDTQHHWAKDYILSLSTHCGVLGYKDNEGRLLGIFKPDEPIKRAELLKMLVDCSELSPGSHSMSFSDVEKGSWYEAALSVALSAGWVQGYSDGTFRPFINMNRAEGLKMILRSRFSEELIGNKQNKVFSDVDISSWYQKYIAFAFEKGFVAGKQSGKFLPGDPITRAEAAKIIATVFGWNTVVTSPENTNQNTTPDTTLSSTKLSSTCSVFPADNPWNRDISKDPVHTNSANYIASILNGKSKLHPDFGSNPDYGIPYSIVDNNQKKIPVTVVSYPEESDLGSYPIPDNQKIEAGGDRHVLVADKDSCTLYELYGAEKTSSGWNADSAAIFDLASNALRPDYWTSADAAGLPIFPGLVKYDEVKSGKITHALRFTVSKTQKAFIHPATHFASSSTDSNLPPMGLRLRLKAGFDISGYSGDTKVILEALKTYGMILADNGSDWFISGATDSRWDDEDLGQLKNVPGSAFEAVESGPLIK